MKKNAIGHMHPEKKGFLFFWKKLHFIPLLICILLAVLLWLLVKNFPELNKAGLLPDFLKSIFYGS